MAYVPHYEHDVFLSYAHQDGPGWIAPLAAELTRALYQLIGVRKSAENAVKIYFDQNRGEDIGEPLEDILLHVRRSAVFVAIVSPSYVRDERFTIKELREYAKTAPKLGKIFPVECRPLDEDMPYPPEIDSLIKLKLWRPRNAVPQPLSPKLVPFKAGVQDLAGAIKKHLDLMVKNASGKPRGKRAASSSSRPPASTQKNRFKILLAQVREDLEDDRDKLRRLLDQETDVEVIARDYPQGGEEFAREFEADLSNADYLVQVLGAKPSRGQQDLRGGYDCFQAAAAGRIGKPVLQWLSRAVDLDDVDNLEHRELLDSSTVRQAGMGEFAGELLRNLRAPAAESTPPIDRTLVIKVSPKDRAILAGLDEIVSEHNLYVVVATPAMEKASVNRKLLRQQVKTCTAMFVVYGSAGFEYVDTNLLECLPIIKSRQSSDNPIRSLAVLLTRPEPREPLNVMVPMMKALDCTRGLDPVKAELRRAMIS